MTSEDKLDKILDRLTEISKWTKLQGLEKFSQIALSVLKSNEEKIAFELSNGIRSANEISSQSGIAKSTITNYWRKWAKSGIVEESEKFSGRMKHIVSLEEAGINISENSKKSKENKNEWR